ncbi:MAG: hypothetical protein ISS43_01600 [Candidatus Omnitrophica bacterium]|nr:hypothetical protein [Candidatus Omnitrophota bacterium]
MIVPMKKVAILVQSKEAPCAIEKLRSLGVVHVEHQQMPKGKDISSIQDEIALVKGAISVLSEPEFLQQGLKSSQGLTDWKFTARHIVDLHNRLDQLQEYSLTLKNRISQWEAWGDFDPDAIRTLGEKGVYIRFYQISVKEIKNLPSTVTVKKISTVRGIANCLLISREKPEVPFKEIALPQRSLQKMRARLSENSRIMKLIREDIREHTCYRKPLMRTGDLLRQKQEFHEALRGMGQSGDLMYLSGYIPYDAAAALLETSKKEKWGVTINEPSPEDNVPTFIRNPRWVSIIGSVFKVIEIIPGYRELDISLWFLIFFSVFFGMLIGDAAYGVIFFMLTLFAQRKWGHRLSNKSPFILFYLLSCCAIIWGVLSGTFFGQEWLPASVKPLIPALRNDRNVQGLCFLLGAFHLSIAHLWRAIIKLPSRIALGEIGWISILWVAFFLAKMLVLGDAFPAFGKWFFILGIALVIFFTSPSRNILKGIGAGLANLALNLVNSFTDVVSYIRLFAVGLATVAVADAFNKMALEIGYNSILTGVATSLILLLGHSLNILLGPMSILVHGVRLNILEFCSHLDIKWSGFAYKPLRQEKT